MTWKIHIDDVPEERQEWSWEGHDYQRYRKHLSVALGHDGSHPFDVERVRLAPGRAPCPVHEHSAMWEFFLVVSGSGEVHRNGETHTVAAGDCFLQPPGTRHRVRNASDREDLVFYVIANETPTETTKHLP
jgi:mannose-6-phosphate isomerase-like protein (cupin superfamily)